MLHRISRFALVAALTAGISACASTGTIRSAERAEQAQDYDRAVAEYSAAVKKHPNDRTAKLELDRAKLRASQDHLTRGRRLEAAGKLDAALVEYQIASDMNPGNSDIDAAMRTVRS